VALESLAARTPVPVPSVRVSPTSPNTLARPRRRSK
jgi:hypothetical protein